MLSGCGGIQYFDFAPAQHAGHGHAPVPHPRQAHASGVNVYFCTKVLCATGATRRDERFVGAALRREPCVRQVVFISKAKALAKMNKMLGTSKVVPPGLGNPLPDAFDVTPDQPSCAPAIAAAARAAHWPGVQQVALKRRPATRAGS